MRFYVIGIKKMTLFKTEVFMFKELQILKFDNRGFKKKQWNM